MNVLSAINASGADESQKASASHEHGHGRVPSGQSALDADIAARLKRDNDGLVPAIIQEADSCDVLMLGYMDDEALHRTLTSGRVTFWSRSRREYWRKGDSSGHVQKVETVALDCDGDTLLVRVRQTGAACHTGQPTCFTADSLPVSREEAREAPTDFMEKTS